MLGKMIGAHLAVILVVFLTLFVSSAYLLEHYFHRAKRWELMGNVTKLATNLSRFSDLAESAAARAVLDTFQEFTGTTVWVIDPAGNVMLASPDAPEEIEAVLKTLAPLEDGPFTNADGLIDPSARPMTYRSADPATGRPQLSVAFPVIRGDAVAGTVYVHAPLIGVRATVRGVRHLLLFAGMIALVMATIVGYVTAKRIAAPLTSMNRVVRDMTMGDWRGRVDVQSDDEVGRLGKAFNTMAAQLDAMIRQLSREKQKTEAVVQSLTDGVLFVDQEGRVGMANAAAEPVLNVPPETAVGKALHDDVIRPPQVVAMFCEVMGGGEARHETVVVEDRTYSVHISPVSDGAERTWGAVGLFHDTSEQAQLEAMRRNFVADVSHELRTPLTSIRGFLEALADGVPENEAEAEEYLRIAIDETKRLQRLAETLLDVSSMAVGGTAFEPARLPLAQAVISTVDKVMPQALGKGIHITVGIPEDIPDVWADSDKLDQILLNLLDNALHYTPVGGTIRLGARRHENAVEVAVADNGPGIPVSEQPYVWDRFYKVDKARRRVAGSGLGLVIVKQLVELHGGTVGLTSEPGQGAEFTFTLPIAQVVVDRAS